MKITARPDFRASLKSRRMRAAPLPTNISTKLEPEAAKKSTPACPATARASIVLPVPGGPKSSTPRGGWAPSALKRSGSRSHSATSISSSFAASTPCTSSQRTGAVVLERTVSGLVERIVWRSSRTKTHSSPAMKRTPKTGYQAKKKSLIAAAVIGLLGSSCPFGRDLPCRGIGLEKCDKQSLNTHSHIRREAADRLMPRPGAAL